ncbi:MAG TPA: TetR family transcriptional regulator [Pseudonocardiaceae bacterium]|nr:TetR family transcriptional regulator [Pseudonocardiaceae bacterium]
MRERKKAKTRAAIKQHAMRLFEEQGYAETTVDQIAEAAEISPSTFFRYFPTKEAVVLIDEYDPMLLSAMREQPADRPPVAAMRSAIRDVYSRIPAEEWAAERERHRLIFSVPELRASMLDELARTITMLAGIIAEREGVAADGFGVRVLAGAIIGAITATTWDLSLNLGADFFGMADRTLAALEHGLPFTVGEEK